MGKSIGIDLGTTNTAVAVLLDGRPRVLEDDKGYKVLPSCVSLKADESFVVGQSARNLVLTRPHRTAFAVKRLMGRRFDSPEVEQVRRLVGYEIAPADDGSCRVKLGDTWFTPIQLSAEILKVAKSLAERSLGEEVDEAVITVPAYFNHAQRSATFAAAREAGLRCERIINEPTAAALAYGFRKDVEKSIVVYDLGGGTFDVSVLRLSHGIYEVLSTSGDTHLGGEDFDHRIVDFLSEEFQSETGVDLRTDPTALQRLKDAAERAKCELSFTDRTTVLIPRITMADNLEQNLTRLKLEELVERLVQRSLEITRKAVTDAGLRISDVDDVILVGGQTRMPRVREAIAALFQKEPSRGVHPEEVVAIGAAVHANSLTAEAAPSDQALLLDVTPFTLGIDVVGGLFQPIIERNSQVPATATQVFSTARDNQRSVKVTVRQGEDQVAEQNEFLGEFVMSGLTPAARMETKVEVNFRLDVNGMLHVAAVEEGTGERKRITIRNYAEYVTSEGDVQAELEGDLGGELDPGDEDAATPGSAGAPKSGFFSRLFGRKSDGSSPPAPAPSPAAAPEDISPTASPDAVGAVSDEAPEMPAFLADIEPLEPATLEAAPELSPVGSLEPVGGLDELEALEPLEAPLTDLGVADLAPLDEIASAALAAPPVDEGEFTSDYADDEDEFIDDDDYALSDDYGDEAPAEGGDPFGDELETVDPEAFETDLGFTPLGDEPDLWDGPAATEEVEVPEGAELGPTASPTLEVPLDTDAALELPTQVNFQDLGLQALSAPPVDEVDLEGEDEETVVFHRAPQAPTRREPDWRTADDLPPELPSGDPLDEETEANGFDYEEEPTGEITSPSAEEDETSPGLSGGRRPARLRLAYRRADALVAEYRENLERGGCFVRTPRPLRLGRDCVIEVRAPGLREPIELTGVVTWSSRELAELPEGQEPGMGIEYRLSDEHRQQLEATLSSVGG